jgi:hypothetical protein
LVTDVKALALTSVFGTKSRGGKKCQTEAFFNGVESLEYIEDAGASSLKSEAAFPNEECHSPEQVVDLLHQRLVELSAELEQIRPAWDDLNAIRQERHAVSDDLEQYIQDKRTLLYSANEISLTRAKNVGTISSRRVDHVHSLLLASAVRAKRHYQMKLFLDAYVWRKNDSIPGISA